MKVILKQDVNKIGKKGELLEVADGYGRNYLIARGLAEEATEGRIRELQQMQMTQKIKDDKNLRSPRNLKEAWRQSRKNKGKHRRGRQTFRERDKCTDSRCPHITVRCACRQERPENGRYSQTDR